MPIPLSFPFTPASDMAGVVDSIGEGVTRFKPGARVISTFFPEWIDGKPQADARNLPYKTSGGYFQGMLSEYVIVKEDALVASPETLDDAEASTLPCAGLTAWFALVSAASCAPGNRCWCRARAAWRSSPFRLQKRTARRSLSPRGAMKSWRSPKNWGPATASTA